MKTVDQSNLDTRALEVFLMVLRENSVSRAAERLGMSQSAVSHTLDRLRRALSDPLFVKSGRGIVPTRYAVKTGPHVQQILLILLGVLCSICSLAQKYMKKHTP